MVDDTRRPFWRSPTIRRQAAGYAALTAFVATWAMFAHGDTFTDQVFAGALALTFVGIVGAAAIGAAGLVLGWAYDRQIERRRAAAKAFADARPDPRNRTGPSITIWPEDESGVLVAFVEFYDGTVDDLTIAGADARFAGIVELLYRLAEAQVQIASDTIGDVRGLKSTLAIRFPPSFGATGIVKFPPASVDRRNAEQAAREAAFRASMGGGPPTATD